MKYIAIVLIGLAGSSCAGEQELRSASFKSASLLNEYRDQLTGFAARQSTLNQANELRLQQLASMRDQRLGEIETRKLAWELAGDGESLRRLKVISAFGADQILASGTTLNPASKRAPVASLTYDAVGVNGIIQELTSLQDEVGILARAEELLAFGSKLRKAVKKDLDKATNDTGTAAAMTSERADSETTGSTGGGS